MDRRWVGITALMILVVALVVAGCVSSPVSSTQGSSGPVSSVSSGGTSDAKAAGEVNSASISTLSAVAPADTGTGDGTDQKIVYTAQLEIEVKNVSAGTDSLKTIATGSGGYIASSSITTQQETRSAKVVLRVPATAFEQALSDIKAVGTVRSVSTSGEDVTAQYVDLTARKTSYQNQLAQYNEIMKKSVKVEDIITVQTQIDRVQTELDRLEGQLRYLNSRTDLSTITVNLVEPAPIGGDSGRSLIETINEGIAGFFGMIEFLIIALLTLLPLIIVGGAGYGAYRWHRSRKAGTVVTPVQEPVKEPVREPPEQ
jgi:hypothetical protein